MRSLARRHAAATPLQQLARNRVIDWLHAHRQTQAALADAIGQKPNWVSRWIAGEYDADLESLRLMAEFFHQSLAALLGVHPDPRTAEWTKLYDALLPEQRDALLAFARTMVPPPPRR